MAITPITAWQIDGEIVTDSLFSGFKITVDNDGSPELRRQLILGKKAMTNWDKVMKSRDITLLTKVLIQGYGLPSGHVRLCELWELDRKQSRMPKNWCLQTSIVVLKKTPEILLDSKDIKPSQSEGRSTLNTHWKYWCWSWSSSILVIWCKQTTHLKSPWSWERLRAKGEEGVRGWEDWVASLMQWTWTWENFRRWWETGRPGVLQSMGLQRVGHDWAAEQDSRRCVKASKCFWRISLELEHHQNG